MKHEPESARGGSWGVALAALAVIVVVVWLVAKIPDGATWPLWAAGLGLAALLVWTIIRKGRQS